MNLTIATPKTADQLLARLTEVEKMRIRDANPDRLEYLRLVTHRVDNLSAEAFAKVQQLLNAAFKTDSQHPTFGRTWAL